MIVWGDEYPNEHWIYFHPGECAKLDFVDYSRFSAKIDWTPIEPSVDQTRSSIEEKILGAVVNGHGKERYNKQQSILDATGI